MKCPQCNQQPISFLRFILKFNQTKITCRSCEAKLKGNRLLRVLFYSALLFGIASGLSIIFLENFLDLGYVKTLAIFLGIIVILGTPLEILVWKHSGYELDS